MVKIDQILNNSEETIFQPLTPPPIKPYKIENLGEDHAFRSLFRGIFSKR